MLFIRQAEGDRTTARELEDLVRTNLTAGRQLVELEQLYGDVDLQLSTLSQDLEAYNADFEILQELRSSNTSFSNQELDELYSLLGLYGNEVETRLLPGTMDRREYAGRRQLYWRVRMGEVPPGTLLHRVVARAHTRYGMILDEISDGSTGMGFS